MLRTPKFSEDSPTGEIVIYQTDDGKTKIEVRFVNETVWLTQALMAQLFGTSVPNINIHIRNILKEGELDANSVQGDGLISGLDSPFRPLDTSSGQNGASAASRSKARD